MCGLVGNWPEQRPALFALKRWLPSGQQQSISRLLVSCSFAETTYIYYIPALKSLRLFFNSLTTGSPSLAACSDMVVRQGRSRLGRATSPGALRRRTGYTILCKPRHNVLSPSSINTDTSKMKLGRPPRVSTEQWAGNGALSLTPPHGGKKQLPSPPSHRINAALNSPSAELYSNDSELPTA